MTRSKRAKRVRSYITGEKGRNRVRLYAHPRDGTMMLEFRDEKSAKRRVSLRHADFARGKEAADTLAVELRKGEAPRKREMTLQALFDNYKREVTPRKKSQSARGHDKRTLPLFLRAFGADRKPATLNRRDWDSFIDRRRRGELAHRDRKGMLVRARIVEQDLKLLLAVFNWAERSRDETTGEYLLDRNPLRGLKIPKEESPRRPQISAEQFKTLQLVGAEVSQRAECFVCVAWYTGHRAGAIRQLRWSDIDLRTDTIRWRADSDKIGYEHRTPLHPTLAALLRTEQERTGGDGETPVFPSQHDACRPMTREDASDLWSALAGRAEIPQGERYGWHSFRRAFANQLRNVPLKELQTLGGWKNERTVIQVYLQPDEGAQRRALEKLSA